MFTPTRGSHTSRAMTERRRRRRQLRVLLVDDSPEFLDAAERFLKAEEGITLVGRARSGEESLGMVAALAPDLVLMDLVMPGIGGLKATRYIKAVRPAPRVVILTLHDHLPSEMVYERELLICRL